MLESLHFQVTSLEVHQISASGGSFIVEEITCIHILNIIIVIVIGGTPAHQTKMMQLICATAM